MWKIVKETPVTSYEYKHEYYHEERTRTYPTKPYTVTTYRTYWSPPSILPPVIPSLPPLRPWKKILFPSTTSIMKSITTNHEPRVIRLTVDQEAILQNHFDKWPGSPHPADIILLAAETGLSEADVKTWYQIRLAEWRKGQGLGSLTWN